MTARFLFVAFLFFLNFFCYPCTQSLESLPVLSPTINSKPHSVVPDAATADASRERQCEWASLLSSSPHQQPIGILVFVFLHCIQSLCTLPVSVYLLLQEHPSNVHQDSPRYIPFAFCVETRCVCIASPRRIWVIRRSNRSKRCHQCSPPERTPPIKT